MADKTKKAFAGPFTGPVDLKDTPESRAVLARMKEAKVETQSELHELHGKSVVFGDYTDPHTKEVTPGAAGTIDYVVGERFRATMDNGRQPWGLVGGLINKAGKLSYTFPAGA